MSAKVHTGFKIRGVVYRASSYSVPNKVVGTLLNDTENYGLAHAWHKTRL